jgi:crooked neck
MPGPIQAKNRAPAPIQITAEQLLREAKERGLEDVQKAPKQFITDKEELLQYQNAKRKDFEDQIRRNRHHIGIWCRYALWEAASKEFERSRSVFERALSECRFPSLKVLSVYAFKEVLMLIRTICL